MLLNLCAILIIGNVLFLVGIDRTENEVSPQQIFSMTFFPRTHKYELEFPHYFNANCSIVYRCCAQGLLLECTTFGWWPFSSCWLTASNSFCMSCTFFMSRGAQRPSFCCLPVTVSRHSFCSQCHEVRLSMSILPSFLLFMRSGSLGALDEQHHSQKQMCLVFQLFLRL